MPTFVLLFVLSISDKITIVLDCNCIGMFTQWGYMFTVMLLQKFEKKTINTECHFNCYF